MKKYKKWWITIGIVLILYVIGYVYWFAIPKHTANEAVIVFKDDPNLVYEYNYNSKRNTPYHINLLVFKDGSSQEDDQVKHPPLQEQND
ncbi:DUF3139 domain-containing protein [Listeria monocytogenes]|uniref:DUF3139 domain-containing protein n=1 Tax=Listeria monocytogenes TaxID=1639 RepID=UPI00037A3198|nr:DUF3139 domain-containing protein [Listeria monocytogenes]